MTNNLVIPAQAGAQDFNSREGAKNAKGISDLLRAFASSREVILGWVPAFAGMTKAVL